MSRTRARTLATAIAVVSVLAVAKNVPARTEVTQPQQQDHQLHHQAIEPSSESQAQSSAKQNERPGGMMADADAKLDALVAKMNAATGAQKVDAIAELLTALVQQHKSMRERMMADPVMMQMHRMMDKKDAGK
jgi:hypothetical protein